MKLLPAVFFTSLALAASQVTATGLPGPVDTVVTGQITYLSMPDLTLQSVTPTLSELQDKFNEDQDRWDRYYQDFGLYYRKPIPIQYRARKHEYVATMDVIGTFTQRQEMLVDFNFETSHKPYISIFRSTHSHKLVHYSKIQVSCVDSNTNDIHSLGYDSESSRIVGFISDYHQAVRPLKTQASFAHRNFIIDRNSEPKWEQDSDGNHIRVIPACDQLVVSFSSSSPEVPASIDLSLGLFEKF